MSGIFSVLFDPDITLIRYAVLAGLLAGVSLGIVGSFTVARRITSVTGALSHSVLGGIGFALYARSVFGFSWFHPLYGALFAGILSAFILSWVSSYAKEREDTAISAVWATGMAVGLLFIARTPGYVDPMSYLFGDILLISRQDLYLIALLDALVFFLTVMFYPKLIAVCFDEEFARARGIPTERYHLVLLLLSALTVVLLVSIVGIVLVVALLALPAALAAQFTRRMTHMMVVASLFAMLFTSGGIVTSYVLDFPTGPCIILLAAGCYYLVLAAQYLSIFRIKY